MNKLYICFSVAGFIVMHFAAVQAQDSTGKKVSFPEGITVEYGIGSLAVTDEYISEEKYSGSIPYYSIGWSKQHSDYVYHLKIDFRNSPDIKNYNVSTDIYQFTLNQGFSYALPEFTIFDKDADLYLGPASELFFYYNRQNIAVSGFDYAQSFVLLISGGICSELYYKLWDDLILEGALDFGVLSLGFRMVDEEETDESPVKILTLFSAANMVFKIGPRYCLFDNLSVKASYLFHLTRISSWEPLLSAGDNVILTLTYGF
jgi:hypothetical protein